MDQQSSNPTPESTGALSVKEAALRLGVSERTVYRHLKSGKLKRSHLRDRRDIYDKMTVTVSRIGGEIEVEKASHEMSNSVENVDSAVREDTLTLLREELAKRDAQISTLLETQRDLAQTVQKQSEQLSELAHFVLSLSAASEAKASADEGAKRAAANPRPLFA